jgi:ferredoxin
MGPVTVPLLIDIDRDACVGSSVCIALAGDVFRLDAKGISTVIDPAGASLGEILEAAEGCPTMAIRVRRADTGASLFPPAAP